MAKVYLPMKLVIEGLKMPAGVEVLGASIVDGALVLDVSGEAVPVGAEDLELVHVLSEYRQTLTMHMMVPQLLPIPRGAEVQAGE